MRYQSRKYSSKPDIPTTAMTKKKATLCSRQSFILNGAIQKDPALTRLAKLPRLSSKKHFSLKFEEL